jgi:hypothetical protein
LSGSLEKAAVAEMKSAAVTIADMQTLEDLSIRVKQKSKP